MDDEVWKEEDRPIIEKFWKFYDKFGVNWKAEDWTPEAKASFEHYKKCCTEYGDDEWERKRSVQHLTEFEVAKIFLFKLKNYDDDLEENGEYEIIPSELIKELSFPLVVVGAIDSDYDRGSECSVGHIDVVSKIEFDDEI